MSPSMPPRALRAADLDTLAELETHGFDVPWSREALTAELAKATTRSWCFEDDDGLAAYALFQVVADEAELLRIAVDPEQRRRGLGRRLLDHALEELAAEGVSTCHLEVRADNTAAHGLYRRLGFEITGRRRVYYRDGCDALLFGMAIP